MALKWSKMDFLGDRYAASEKYPGAKYKIQRLPYGTKHSYVLHVKERGDYLRVPLAFSSQLKVVKGHAERVESGEWKLP